jgi:hypothetical protein
MTLDQILAVGMIAVCLVLLVIAEVYQPKRKK